MLSVSLAQDKVEKLVEQARRSGADAADTIYVGERSSGVQVRKGALEDVHRSEGEEIGLRVFLGSKSASVASSDQCRSSRRTAAGAWRAIVQRPQRMASTSVAGSSELASGSTRFTTYPRSP